MRPRFMLSIVGLLIGIPVFLIALLAAVSKHSPGTLLFFVISAAVVGASIWAFIKYRTENVAGSQWVEKQKAVRAFTASLNTPEYLGPPGAVAAILVLIYAVLSYLGKISPLAPTTAQLYRVGAGYGRTIAHGQSWRLFTEMFLHGSIDHLLGNVIALVLAGRLLVFVVGWQNFLAIYLIGGLFGAMASAIYHPDLTCVGASGAIFALYGALLAGLMFNPDLKTVGASRVAILYSLLYAFRALMNGLAHNGIDNSAHLGGLVAGFAIMSLIYVERENAEHQLITFGTSAATIALAAFTILPGVIKPSQIDPIAMEAGISEVQHLLGNYEGLLNEYTANSKHGNDAETQKTVLWVRTSFNPRYQQVVSQLHAVDGTALPPKLRDLVDVVVAQGDACVPMYSALGQRDRSIASINQAPGQAPASPAQLKDLINQCLSASARMKAMMQSLKK